MGRLYILEVTNAGNFSVNLRFNDGSCQTVNIGEFLNERKFKEFTLENGNIVGGKNWDLVFTIEQQYAGEIE